MLFLIIFLSPVYFAIQNKWGAFTVNLVLYVLAWLTIWIFGLGMFFWAFGVAHAMWHYRKQEQVEQARTMATEIVKAQAFAKEVQNKEGQ